MTNRKSRFWTFVFSLIPGAGEMYMGFFKHGVSVMALFFFIFSVSAFLNFGALLFLEPILWFYSFFHVHSLKSLPDEEFYAVEDDFLIPLRGEVQDLNLNDWLRKYRKPLAFVLIFIGVVMLWQSLLSIIGAIIPGFLSNFYWGIYYDLPQVAIGLLILALGVYLVSGKKKKLHQEEQRQEAGRENDFGYQKDAYLFQELPAPEDTPKTDSSPSEAQAGEPTEEKKEG